MPRKHDAPWVVLGMPDKNKMLISYRAKLGGHETAICERVRTEDGDKPGTVYMRLMWCNKEAVKTFRDHLTEMLETWDELTDREGRDYEGPADA